MLRCLGDCRKDGIIHRRTGGLKGSGRALQDRHGGGSGLRTLGNLRLVRGRDVGSLGGRHSRLLDARGG